jgi:hypothetical protein
LSERRNQKKVARYRLNQEFYGPPKESLDPLPVNRVAFYFEKLRGITPRVAISPIFPDPYGRTGELDPNPPLEAQSVRSLVATSGSSVTPDTTPDTGNAIEMPVGYSELMIYVGDLGLATEKAVLYVKVGSAAVKEVEVLSWGCYCLQDVDGETIAFGAATNARNSNSLVNGTLPLKAVATIGQAQVAPSGKTGTISLDRCPPNLYTPARACIAFDGEFQRFGIAPAAVKRDIFLVEWDGGVNVTPVRHIHIPENQPIVVECRYPVLFLASIDTATLTVSTPAGANLATDAGIVWEPSFTASKVITVSTVAEFKTAMNDASDNVEVRMIAGVYDLQAAGSSFWMRINSYGSAMSKNRRIVTASGGKDVIFRVANPGTEGGQWYCQLYNGTSAVSWIIKNVTWDITGQVVLTELGSPDGMIEFRLSYGSTCHTIGCVVTGAIVSINTNATTGGDTSIKWQCFSGTSVNYAAWCNFSGAADDLTAANNQGAGSCTLHQIGNYLDGNGSRNDAQIVTNHSGGIMALWGCSFGNLTTGTTTRVASDGPSSPDYLLFCRSYPANFVTVIGINVTGSGPNNPSFLHFCDFQAAGVFDAIKSVVCSTIKTYTTGRPMVYTTSTITSKWIGSDLYSATTGSDIMLDANDGNVLVRGCRLTYRSSSTGVGMMRVFRSTGGPWTGTVAQCLFRVLSGANPYFNLSNTGTSANQQYAITNTIFVTGGAGAIGLGTTANSTTNTIANSFIQKPTDVNTAPNNWDTRFPTTTWASLGTNKKSSSAPNLNSYDQAVHLGDAQDVDGLGGTGVIGSTDVHGRPFLGGAWDMGCAESTAVRSNGFLRPLVWVSA